MFNYENCPLDTFQTHQSKTESVSFAVHAKRHNIYLNTWDPNTFQQSGGMSRKTKNEFTPLD